MFIEANEMETVVAAYQVEEMTDYTPAILHRCIAAAVKRVSRLLSGRYDVERIFGATGDERDDELVEICKDIALWFLVRRCNVDILYGRVKEAYDRDMAYLRDLMKGDIPSVLPLRQEEGGGTAGAARFGSQPKFRHSW